MERSDVHARVEEGRGIVHSRVLLSSARICSVIRRNVVLIPVLRVLSIRGIDHIPLAPPLRSNSHYLE